MNVRRLSCCPWTYLPGCCTDCRYQTIPLHRAAAYSHLDIATLLLEKGADIEVCSVASAAQYLSACTETLKTLQLFSKIRC